MNSSPEHPPELSHIDEAGHARMVDVTSKESTERRAVASGRIRMSHATLSRIVGGLTPKGDVLAVARIAGIQAGKRTADLIPLCHVLPGASVAVTLEADEELPGITARSEATCIGRTGVEMEALTATAVALLAVYDMVKGLERGMVIEALRLEVKEGGRSGVWTASDDLGRR